MAEEKYVLFIDGIIEKTKAGDMQWCYLDTNEALYEGMHWVRTTTEWDILRIKEKTVPNFNEEDSFYATMGNMSIVLYTYGTRPADLYVVPDTYKKVVHMTADEYGDRITRLLNLVQSQFPNAEDFIDRFLGNNKDEE